MKLTVTDAAGYQQTVLVNGQESITDHSGVLPSNIAQTVLAANNLRSGFFIQNLSSVNSMWFNEIGTATNGAGSIKLLPNAFISTNSGFPLSTGALSLIGTSGDSYTLREW